MKPLPATLPARLLILAVLICGVAAAVWINVAGARPPESLAEEIRRELAGVETVRGRLDIALQGVVLQQELWVQRPDFFRTETAAGPEPYRGVIVVLNDQEGWVYSPTLDTATVVDRSQYTSEFAGEAGAGSLLERLPDNLQQGIAQGYPVNRVGDDVIAGRSTDHYEIVIPQGDASFPAGPLHVWLDKSYAYPLALLDSNGRQLKFTSIEFNADIEAVTFTFVPPPGAVVRRVNPTQ
jgi:outer membrane lipoprotein-sorting protein